MTMMFLSGVFVGGIVTLSVALPWLRRRYYEIKATDQRLAALFYTLNGFDEDYSTWKADASALLDQNPYTRDML